MRLNINCVFCCAYLNLTRTQSLVSWQYMQSSSTRSLRRPCYLCVWSTFLKKWSILWSVFVRRARLISGRWVGIHNSYSFTPLLCSQGVWCNSSWAVTYAHMLHIHSVLFSSLFICSSVRYLSLRVFRDVSNSNLFAVLNAKSSSSHLGHLRRSVGRTHRTSQNSTWGFNLLFAKPIAPHLISSSSSASEHQMLC